jgi:hypothetical protein
MNATARLALLGFALALSYSAQAAPSPDGDARPAVEVATPHGEPATTRDCEITVKASNGAAGDVRIPQRGAFHVRRHGIGRS